MFYALVMQGKVLGFRDHIDELSLGLAERTALVAWSGEEISIYEVDGAMPHDADAAMRRLEAWLSVNPDAEPVSIVRAELEDDEQLDPEVTGCFRRVDGESGGSGFFASIAVG